MIEQEKSKILYHGSATGGLKILLPDNKRTRGVDEGPLVFGTSVFEFALMFMSPRAGDSWTRKGAVGYNQDNFIYYYLISDEQRFREGDKGGVIYEFLSDTFYQKEGIGMKNEWISKEPVKILKETYFPSTINALIDNNAKVRFVTPEELKLFDEMTPKKRYNYLI